jgi:hypothetical protein
MPSKRRSWEEVKSLALQAQGMIEGNEGTRDAVLKKLGLASSVYTRAMRRLKGNGSTGSVRADALPPRPKKGGKRVPKPVDMGNVLSIAARISKLDKQIDKVFTLKGERKNLAKRLAQLLTKDS